MTTKNITPDSSMTTKEVWALIDDSISRNYGLSVTDANVKDMYNAVSRVIKEILQQKRRDFNREFKAKTEKRVHYLSMEFLLGRSLKNNLFNLGLTEVFGEALKEHGFELAALYEQEPDAGLGNGGLGRLAACYLDALASGNYPATGHSLRYEYGIFQQKLVDGWQTELPDNWLPGGEVWLTQRADKALTVRFGGKIKEVWQENKMVSVHTDYQEVEAMPYDLMVSGYKSQAVSVLRLWSARNKHRFDMRAFSQGEYMQALKEDAEAEIITKVLYPADDTAAGKTLRLKQQYFLVSAAVQDITNDHLKRNPTLANLPDQVAIQLNDTHPALVVPELMRILLDEQGFDWDRAWDITTRTCAYTNHTVMSEALEVWQADFFQRNLPRIYDIVKEINQRASNLNWQKSQDWNKVSKMAILAYDQARMANLAIVGSHAVNGVSQLHTDILKKDVFVNFDTYYPNKIINITNGISCRRWLCQSNPRLTSLLVDTIGHGFITDMSQLEKFSAFATDNSVIESLQEIKKANKVDFSNYLKGKTGQLIDPNTRYDVQVKRLHEYKRQLLNVLKIVELYNELLDNPDKDVTPQTFIFGAKAASSYYMAKEIIKLIVKLGEDIDKHPKIKEKLNVVFLENYCVTTAEKLMPSAEVSQQISLAGKEASGTGNMKFMINGALTVGTLDGANVEMRDAVGEDNIFIFGLDARGVNELWAEGYNSMDYYFASPALKGVIDRLNGGFNGCQFDSLTAYLLKSQNVADPYMCLADFSDYMRVSAKMDKAYADQKLWTKRSIINIAESGRFSADRAIKEYAEKIWNIKPFVFKK